MGTFGDFSQNRGCCDILNTIFVKTIDKCKIIVTFGNCKQKITENGKKLMIFIRKWTKKIFERGGALSP